MTALITRVFRDEIHERMAEALTNDIAHRFQEVDDGGMTEFISVEDAISITAAVLHSLTSDSADPAPHLTLPIARQGIGVLGATYTDAKNQGEYLADAGEIIELSVHGPSYAGHGRVLDALFITPAAAKHPRLSRALENARPALATRQPPRSALAVERFKKAYLGEWPPEPLDASDIPHVAMGESDTDDWPNVTAVPKQPLNIGIPAKRYGKTNAAILAIVDEAHRRGVPITVSVMTPPSNASKGAIS